MNILVSLLCICVAVANAKPFYVFPNTYNTIPTTYNTNLPTPFIVNQPNQFIPTQYRSFYPVQYFTGDASTTPVITQPETTFNTPVFSPQVIPTYRTAVTPFAPSVTRYQTQNTDGSYAFGYSGGPSSRAETRDRFGRVNGVFNYVDPEGKVQTQKYVADTNGFRVAGTNLPKAPFTKTETDINVVPVQRIKRSATTDYKTPASTVPLKQAYTPTFDFTPRVVYNQPIVQPSQFTYPFNFVPTAYTVPATNYVHDNTVARSLGTETVNVVGTYEPKSYVDKTGTKTVPFVTGRTQPTFYSTNYPYFTYPTTNFVHTARDNTVDPRSVPVVYNSAVPYTSFTPTTGFLPTFTDKVVKPTTGYSFYY